MLLQFDSGAPFASGSASYRYQPVTFRETANRIIVNVRVGIFQTQAYLDTGAVYLVCSPEIANALQLLPEDGLESEALSFRGTQYRGNLHRVSLTMLADHGDSLQIEVTAFVPEVSPPDLWPSEFPCILGMNGCCERLRFAIDPASDTFFFGDTAPEW